MLGFLALVGGPAVAELRDGLLLYLPCDEGSGDRLVDRSETGALVRRIGGAEWVDGGPGFRLGIDFRPDPESFLRVEHDFGVLDALTFALRFRVDDPDPARWNYFLDTRSDLIQEAEGAFFLGRNRDGVLRFVDAEADPASYPRKEWAHLAILADDRSVEFYVDGKKVGDGPPTRLNIGDRLVIANRFTLTEALFGAVDEIALWNRLLEPAELKRIAGRPVLDDRNVDATGRLPVRWAALKRDYVSSR